MPNISSLFIEVGRLCNLFKGVIKLRARLFIIHVSEWLNGYEYKDVYENKFNVLLKDLEDKKIRLF